MSKYESVFFFNTATSDAESRTQLQLVVSYWLRNCCCDGMTSELPSDILKLTIGFCDLFNFQRFVQLSVSGESMLRYTGYKSSQRKPLERSLSCRWTESDSIDHNCNYRLKEVRFV